MSLDRRIKKIANNSSNTFAKSFQKSFEYTDTRNLLYRIGNNGSRLLTITNFSLVGVDESFWNQVRHLGDVFYFMPDQAIADIKVEEKSLLKILLLKDIKCILILFFLELFLIKKNNKLTIPQFVVKNYYKTKL